MQLSEKIKNLAKSKHYTMKMLCEKIPMSRLGLHRTLENDTMKVRTLSKISEILEVNITYFLDDNETSFQKKENKPIFTSDEIFIIVSTLFKNKVSDEIVKKIYDLNKENK